MDYSKNMRGSGWNDGCDDGCDGGWNYGCAQQCGMERWPEKKASKLVKTNVSNYEMGQDERIIAQLIQAYLSRMPEVAALELMQEIFKPTAVEVSPQDGTTDILKATVEGRQLAILIDHAVEEYRGIVVAGQAMTKNEEIKKMLGVILDGVKEINGTAAVQKVSFEFYRFLEDIYKALKY